MAAEKQAQVAISTHVSSSAVVIKIATEAKLTLSFCNLCWGNATSVISTRRAPACGWAAEGHSPHHPTIPLFEVFSNLATDLPSFQKILSFFCINTSNSKASTPDSPPLPGGDDLDVHSPRRSEWTVNPQITRRRWSPAPLCWTNCTSCV